MGTEGAIVNANTTEPLWGLCTPRADLVWSLSCGAVRRVSAAIGASGQRPGLAWHCNSLFKGDSDLGSKGYFCG